MSSARSPGPSNSPPISVPRPTAYLDGLRGYAALNVCVYHFWEHYYENLRYAWGFGSDNNHIINLPFIKLLSSGATLVAIFFVVSGFAISFKAIQLIRSRSPSLLKVLSSTIFRRAVRLYMPSIAGVLLIFIFRRLGLIYVSPELTFLEDVGECMSFLTGLFNLPSWSIYVLQYQPHLWTIPAEFRCSMVVFLMLLGLGRCRMRVRLATELGVAIHASYFNRWEIVPFMCGMILAELHHHRASRVPPGEGELDASSSWTRLSDAILGTATAPPCLASQIALYAFFVLGIWVGGYPRYEGCSTPSYRWMCRLGGHGNEKGFYRHMSSYAGVLICTPIAMLPRMQRMFTTPFAAYLGKISFALYLTHRVVLKVVAYPLMDRTWGRVDEEASGVKMGIGLGFFVLFIMLSFWVADVFERAVDGPSVRLARWLEEMCLKKDGEDEKGKVVNIRSGRIRRLLSDIFEE